MMKPPGGTSDSVTAAPPPLHPLPLSNTPSVAHPLCPLNTRIKWGDNLNGTWLQENPQAVVLRETTLPLYDKLVQNKVSAL